jgi:hypothetical protein
MAPNELDELTPIAEKLNEQSNEINTTIAAFNAKLEALNVGLEEWLDPDEDHFQVGYAKVGDRWQLAARRCPNIKWIRTINSYGRNDGYYEAVPGAGLPRALPLLQAPRELRIRALGYMPAMIRQLKQRAEGSLDAIRAAKKLAAEL